MSIVVTLGLKREGNSWICPRDGYVEVSRLSLDSVEKPVLLEIKSEYLKDYLCARDMALYITSFYSRQCVSEGLPFINWENGKANVENEYGKWRGSVTDIHEGGEPFGSKTAVFHVSRTDVNEAEDVPEIAGPPTDENIRGESWEHKFEGRKLQFIIGEYWANEFVLPAEQSPKVRNDEVASHIYFIVDANGSKTEARNLRNSGKWLWFNPGVITALASRRGGKLKFHTKNTGSVGCSYGNSVHFGVNGLGYINVYAKDIGCLPEWQQQIWVGYNISPDGGVSEELLAAQVRGLPVNTQAPESFLIKGIEFINELSNKKLGIVLFKQHDIFAELLPKIHRFRATDNASLYSLSKDIARITADSLDTVSMNRLAPPPKGIKWGSLKSLENLLALHLDRDKVRNILTPLVGVYELRHADAHLPGHDIDSAFGKISIDRSLSFVYQGHKMLSEVVGSLFQIVDLLEDWPQ